VGFLNPTIRQITPATAKTIPISTASTPKYCAPFVLPAFLEKISFRPPIRDKIPIARMGSLGFQNADWIFIGGGTLPLGGALLLPTHFDVLKSGIVVSGYKGTDCFYRFS